MFFLSLLLAATITTKADVPRLTPAELRAAMAKGDAIALDVRGSVPFKYGHVENAIWMPLGRIGERFAELPQDKLLVAYCSCKAEELSLEAAMQLAQKHGFERVAVLTGGYPAWKEAGYPIAADRTVQFEQGQPAAPEAKPGAAGRLAPPEAVRCDRNQLTSYAGTVQRYERSAGTTVLVIETSAGTTETVTLHHEGSDDPSPLFLVDGKPLNEKDMSRLKAGLSAVAWVCADGSAIVDWRPGATFSGAE